MRQGDRFCPTCRWVFSREVLALGDPLEVMGGQRMLHRFDGQPVLLKPPASATMQLRHQLRLRLQQVAAQHLGKQVVVAVPTSLVLQGDYKQVRPLERFQHRLASLLACYCIIERSAEPLQDARVQEKLLH